MDDSPLRRVPPEVRLMIIELLVQDTIILKTLHGHETVNKVKDNHKGEETEARHIHEDYLSQWAMGGGPIPINCMLPTQSSRALAMSCREMNTEVVAGFCKVRHLKVPAQDNIWLGCNSTLQSVLQTLGPHRKYLRPQDLRVEMRSFREDDYWAKWPNPGALALTVNAILSILETEDMDATLATRVRKTYSIDVVRLEMSTAWHENEVFKYIHVDQGKGSLAITAANVSGEWRQSRQRRLEQRAKNQESHN